MSRSVSNPPMLSFRCGTRGAGAVLAVVIVAIGAGCASMSRPVASVALREPFDESAAQAMLEPGPNTIACTAQVPPRDGSTVSSAVRSATLIPATPYAAERMRAMFGSDERGSTSSPAPRFTPDCPAYAQASRQAVGDEDGLFEFTHVKDGDYFVVATVDWVAATPAPAKPLASGAVYRVRGGNEVVQRGVTPPATAAYGSGSLTDTNDGTRVLMKRVRVSGGVRVDIVLEP